MTSSSNAVSDSQIAMSLDELQIVCAILRRHLTGRDVWVYGSRARGTRVKKYSDLDLAIEGPVLPEGTLGQLANEFDESILAFKVDLVEVESLSPEFRKRIEADKVMLPLRK